MKMIDSYAIKTILLAIVSIFSYLVSQVTGFISTIDFMPVIIEEGIVDIILERAARTVAVAAGLVAIWKGFQSKQQQRKSKNKNNEV